MGFHKRQRILSVEDNPADLKLLERTLRKALGNDFSLINVSRLEDAQRVLKQLSFDIVLLDLTLPDSHGIDTVRCVREVAPDIALVVLTGSEDEDLGLQSLQAGAQDYMIKGGDIDQPINRVMRYAIERHRCDEQILYMAQHDTLTALPNRGRFMQHLEISLARAYRVKSQAALLFIDLDNFKTINDTMGHDSGDHFLTSIAQRFQQAIRSTDFLARLGGDEFTVLVECTTGIEEPIAVAEKLLATLIDPIILPNQEQICASCSIGIAVYDGKQQRHDAPDLIRCADAAMYNAKQRSGSCYQFYDQRLAEEAESRVYFTKGLNLALINDEYKLYYQPIYSPSHSGFDGMEALIRWNDPQRGITEPAKFIPLLEEINLINDVGDWVLHTACQQFSHWLRAGKVNVNNWISVNVSAKQYQSGHLAAHVQRELEESCIPGSCLHLEMTESVFMKDKDKVVSEMLKLKSLGVFIDIDDFGTGFSSMQYLADLPFDHLKIDRSFIQNFLSRPQDKMIACAIINLAHNLGKGVVAEGVETGQLALALEQAGCDYLQGYYFARPQPSQDYRFRMGSSGEIPDT